MRRVYGYIRFYFAEKKAPGFYRVPIFTLSSGGVSAAPPLIRRIDEVVDLVVLAMGDPGWITAKAELVPAKSATRKKGFKAIMLIGHSIQVSLKV